jgi:hypothetical protein
MTTWKHGRSILAKRMKRGGLPPERVVEMGAQVEL